VITPDGAAARLEHGNDAAMLDRKSKTGLRTRLLVFARLRFGLTNFLMAAFLSALLQGGYVIWLVLGVTLLGWAAADELGGDDRDFPLDKPHWFYEANLYATLPLIVAISFVYARDLRAADLESLDLARVVCIIATAIGVGAFYGLAANVVGHELIHRSNQPVARTVGRMLFAFSFECAFPFFHLRVHHRDAGIFSDPSTGRRGESFYAFAPRIIGGTLRAAFDYESRRLERLGKNPWNWRNRMLRGEAWSIAILIAFAGLGGLRGAAGFLASAAIGKVLLAAISYSQHYGLVRVEGAPFTARHAWDCYRPISDALLYNLPRHSDHHLHGGKTYCELGTTSQAPELPYGYHTMALIALVPPLWNRIMGPLLADWDRRLASEGERRLLHERGWASETEVVRI